MRRKGGAVESGTLSDWISTEFKLTRDTYRIEEDDEEQSASP
jgi:hypothetical protein